MSDASSVMLNSCRVCRTLIRELTSERSLTSAVSSYIWQVIGQSASRAIQWCSRWSLTEEDKPQRKKKKKKKSTVSSSFHPWSKRRFPLKKKTCKINEHDKWIYLCSRTNRNQKMGRKCSAYLAPRHTSTWNFPSLPMFLDVLLMARMKRQKWRTLVCQFSSGATSRCSALSK